MDFVFTTSDGIAIAGHMHPAAGTARANLVLVHGLGEHMGRYQAMAKALAWHGINVWTYDQRGHGQSPGKRGVARLSELSADAAAMVAHAKDETGLPTALFGHSMGGGVGLNTLLRLQPDVCCAIITGPWIELGRAIPAPLLGLIQRMPRLFAKASIANGIAAEALSHDPAIVSAYGSDQRNHDRVGLLLAADLCQNAQWLYQNATRLPAPLLLMHGQADSICSIQGSRRFAAAAGERCRFVEYPNMLHELHNEPELQASLFDTQAAFILSHI